MVWPFARSKGGSSSSVAALIAVETNALISALRAVAVAASMTMTIATMRMTIPAADPAPRRMVSHARASVRRLGASLQPAAVGRQSPLRLRSICDMAPRLPRSNALKLFPRCQGMESGMKVARKKIAKKTAKKTAKSKKPAKKAAPKKAAARKAGPGRGGPAKSPISSEGGPITWNFKLMGHHLLDGFGGMGEGMSIQIAPDGRRILWLAHESAPKNFTAVDVSDPRKPKVVVQTDLPQAHMRSNSLETCGNIMAVAYQTQKKGLQPAGMELFDISVPEKPRSISFFDCSGATSRGVHQLWFCDGEYVHCASGAPDFTPTHPNDDQ